jgi:hypothetical protein
MGKTVIPKFIYLLVGYHFRFLRHVSAHVPLPGIYIRGEWGKIIVYQFIASAAAIVATSTHFCPPT